MNKEIFIPDSAPFKPEQAQALNRILPTLSPDQLIWLEGLIDDLQAASNTDSDEVIATTTTVDPPNLTVLYGSESGNAEALADKTVKAAGKENFTAKALNMGDITPDRLKKVKHLLVIVSTWGEGDPPENATDFYQELMANDAPKFQDVHFSVCGLGDTSYEHFCKIGKDMDERLEALGGKRIFDRMDCDVDYDDNYETWFKGSMDALKIVTGPALSTPPAPNSKPVVTAPATVKYSKKNPWPAELKKRVQLNGKGSAKETLHLEFDLKGSGLHYEVGDSLGVVPQNSEKLADALIAQTGFTREEKVTLKDREFTLRQAFISELDITTLSKPVLTRYNEIANCKDLATVIEDKNLLKKYIYGRDVLDLIKDFPARDLTAQNLCASLRKLPSRLYSIASSSKAHKDEVHLTVGVIRYESQGRKREGVCSTFQADRIEAGDKVYVFICPNKHFRLPSNPETPIIMVGPGTGIAPFRAFMEERATTGATGKNWLFFGEQHYLTDFLYQIELQNYLNDGLLTKLDVSFSRDQAQKIYVQDRMMENSQDIYKWLEDGAFFYVCGDANHMASDVDKALHGIVAKEGNMSEEDASVYLKQLKSDKRYLRDVY